MTRFQFITTNYGKRTSMLVTMLVILSALFFVAALVYAAIQLAYRIALTNKWATVVKQNTAKIVVAGADKDGKGGTLVRVIENVKGWYWERKPGYVHLITGEFSETVDDGVLTDTENPEYGQWVHIPTGGAIVKGKVDYRYPLWRPHRVIREILRRRYGISWVSILYPLRSILEFDITRVRLAQAVDPNRLTSSLAGWSTGEKAPETVDNIRIFFPRPIPLEGIEFGRGRFQANLGVYILCRVVVPEIPTLRYDRDFFSMLQEAVTACVQHFARDIELEEFLSDKEKHPVGPGSGFFEKHLAPLNQKVPGKSGGLIDLIGIQITDGWISVIEVNPETLALFQAKQTAILKGDAEIAAAERTAKATITEASGEAQAIERLAEANQKGLKALVEAAQGDSRIVMARLAVDEAEKAAGGSLSTYVKGGGTGVVVPTQPLSPNPNKPYRQRNKSSSGSGTP